MLDKERILKNIQINPDTQCWEWIRSLDNKGYGYLEISKHNKTKKIFSHRYSYQAFVAIITSDMSIDHKCRNRKCCNPDHLRILSIKDNLLCGNTIAAKNSTKTHCLRGHEFNEENTYHVRGERVCKKCAKIRAESHKLKPKIEKMTILDKILSKTKIDEDGCLIWLGGINNVGYGYLKVNKISILVHKALYREIRGGIPVGFNVYRKCGNKMCCAIEHLHLLPNGTVPIVQKIITLKTGG